MAQKTPTSWKHNPAKTAGVAYSSPVTQYSAAAVPYSSANVGLPASGKVAGSWASQSKTATKFVPNPLANTNLYPYDSSIKTYDSTVDTYDGIVSGQDFGDQETPTAWSPL